MGAYATVKGEAQIEIAVNKSRFIGYCAPMASEESARAYLEEIRKKHRDASHNCYAYSIGEQGETARFSDDGEPGGTAGLPMMEAIRQKGLTNLICVVTRYFGGVLLGAGGLVRAYSKTAAAAMDEAGPIEMRHCVCYRLEMDYSSFSLLEPLLHRLGEVERMEYAEGVRAWVIILQENGDAFVRTVVDKTDGKIVPIAEEKRYAAFPI